MVHVDVEKALIQSYLHSRCFKNQYLLLIGTEKLHIILFLNALYHLNENDILQIDNGSIAVIEKIKYFEDENF